MMEKLSAKLSVRKLHKDNGKKRPDFLPSLELYGEIICQRANPYRAS